MLQEVTCITTIFRIVLALFLGGILGIERGMKNRPAGIRTHMLVCIGSCLIMLTNQYVYQVLGTGDPVRMGAQVVSGIGFLGAGTIIVTRHSQIKGLTTAAGLWAAAAVGLAVGIGFYEAAVGGSVAIFIVLTLLNKIDDVMHRNTKDVELLVELSAETSLIALMDAIEHILENITITYTEQDRTESDGTRTYIILLRAKRRMDHAIVLDAVRNISGVIHVAAL